MELSARLPEVLCAGHCAARPVGRAGSAPGSAALRPSPRSAIACWINTAPGLQGGGSNSCSAPIRKLTLFVQSCFPRRCLLQDRAYPLCPADEEFQSSRGLSSSPACQIQVPLRSHTHTLTTVMALQECIILFLTAATSCCQNYKAKGCGAFSTLPAAC